MVATRQDDKTIIRNSGAELKVYQYDVPGQVAVENAYANVNPDEETKKVFINF